jgi:hypothetical protein
MVRPWEYTVHTTNRMKDPLLPSSFAILCTTHQSDCQTVRIYRTHYQ